MDSSDVMIDKGRGRRGKNEQIEEVKIKEMGSVEI